jgi:hypothetical protein
MTAIADAGLLSSADVAQTSGLRQDLVERFVPATAVETPSGRLYPAASVAIAVMVKGLTDAGAPAPVIDARVRDAMVNQPSAAPPPPEIQTPAPTVSRRTLRTAVGATAAAALVLGGLVGGLLVARGSNGAASTAAPATVAAPAPELNPKPPAAPDPICAEWAPIADAAHAAGAEWGSKGGDPLLPATSWTPEQRNLNAGMVSVLKRQADDLRRLAGAAEDPFLAALLRAQANYQDQFASRLLNYVPSDQALWRAASDYAAAVRSTCKTVAPR